MKFRWSEWLTAAALVLAFSAFAAAEAGEAPLVLQFVEDVLRVAAFAVSQHRLRGRGFVGG